MEKTLILVRGVSGAGKSTLAGIFENIGSFTTVAADDYWGPDYDFDIRKIHLAHGDLIYSTWHYRWFRTVVKSWLVTTAASLLPGQWMDRFATRSAQISRAQDRYRTIRHHAILETARLWLGRSAADFGIFGHFHVPYAEKTVDPKGLLLGLDSWDIPNALVLHKHRFQRIFFMPDGHRVEEAKSFFLERR